VDALELVSAWPVGNVAAGVLRASSETSVPPELLALRGDRSRRYSWASVTKITTALAIMVAAEEGTLGLSDPLGPSGSTVAHLLAHASGLHPTERTVLSQPGTRRIYSSSGFELLGEYLAVRAEMPFSLYLTEAVLKPLGMGGTNFPPDGSPARSLEGTLDDLLALGAELLAPTLLSRVTVDLMTSVAFPGLDGVLPGFGSQRPCDWGLGVEVRGNKAPHWTGSDNSPQTFGHFGQAGGFLWVDPVAYVALAVLTDRDFGDWAVESWPALADAV
jgi:CubicO group peptidase (beta-lactamase class C family)